MTSLVTLDNREPVVTSESIAVGVKVGHKSVIQLVRQYEKDLREFGNLAFEMRKSKGAGRPKEYAILNEAQSYFLITLMRNIGDVPKFKKILIKEFMRMKKELMSAQVRQENIQWQDTRKQSKISRLETTDIIKAFTDYCITQGSTHAQTYYGHLTKAEYKALVLMEQKFKNVRDLLTGQQLAVLMTADDIVGIALKYGMDNNMEYHEIFQLAKQRLETFSSIMPKTPVIMLNEIKKLGEGTP